MPRLFANLMVSIWMPFAGFAAEYCDKPLTLLETIAHERDFFETIARNNGSSSIQGFVKSGLIIGRIDEAFQFTGHSFGSEGIGETLEMKVMTTPSASIVMLMSRVPPIYYEGPQPDAFFVGILHAGVPASLGGNETARVFGSECGQGYVLDPTPEYLEVLRACLKTGRCEPL